jgi:hypothetical protein
VLLIISQKNATFLKNIFTMGSRGSSVGTAAGYVLDVRDLGFRFPEEAGNVSLLHRVHTGSAVHPVSYPVGAGGSFPGGKMVGA